MDDLDKIALGDPGEDDATDKKQRYEVRGRDGNLYGLCDDYDGFCTIVSAWSVNRDYSCPHSADKTAFCCMDACNHVLYYALPAGDRPLYNPDEYYSAILLNT